jgi:hypothetical protein
MCAHLLIPMRTLLNKVSRFQPPAEHPTLTKTGSDKTILMLCKQHQSIVYKDNTSALEIANSDLQYCPHTKQISIKWHCFCDQVASGEMTVAKIDTTLQCAIPTWKHVEVDISTAPPLSRAFRERFNNRWNKSKQTSTQSFKITPSVLPLQASSPSPFRNTPCPDWTKRLPKRRNPTTKHFLTQLAPRFWT